MRSHAVVPTGLLFQPSAPTAAPAVPAFLSTTVPGATCLVTPLTPLIFAPLVSEPATETPAACWACVFDSEPEHSCGGVPADLIPGFRQAF